MRQAACNTLPQLAEKGGAANIAAVTSCLKDEHGQCRAACNALPQLAKKGEGSSQVQDLLLVDVTHLPMGSKTAGGVMTGSSSMTPPSSPRRRKPDDLCDNQPRTLIQFFEGERR